MSNQTPDDLDFNAENDVAPSATELIGQGEASGADSPDGETAPNEPPDASAATFVATAVETAPGTSDSPPPASDDAGSDSGAGSTPVADPIGVVRPGDDNTLAAVVVKAVGGVGSLYDGVYVDAVRAGQREYDLEDDGVVQGATWALVLANLPPLRVGYRSDEAQILASLLGMNGRLTLDNDVLDAVEAMVGYTETTEDGERVVNGDTFATVVEKVLNGDS